jgi:hypothetical protein
MRRCVSDRRLWLVHEGEGQPEEQSHVGACPRCAARRDRLARDLDTLTFTLRAVPDGTSHRQRAAAPGWRRAVVAAMLAGVVAVAAVGAWQSRPSRPGGPARSAGAQAVTSRVEVVPFLGDLATSLAPSGPPATDEPTWLDEDPIAATVSSETGLDSLISWDPGLDRDTSRDAETESDI